MAEYQGIDIIESRSDPRDSSRVTKMRIVPISSDDLPPDYCTFYVMRSAPTPLLLSTKVPPGPVPTPS